MLDEAHALRRRLSALGIATAIAGSSLFAAPAAFADPSGAVAEGGELGTALERDLSMSTAEFEAQAALAQQAAAAMPKLETYPGFVSIAIADDAPARLLITGTGAELEVAAAELGAELVAPSNGAREPVPAEENEPSAGQYSARVETATSAQAIFDDYLSTYGPEGLQHLQAIMQNASGQYVVRMAEPAETRTLTRPTGSGPSAEAFESRYTNVETAKADGPAEPLADAYDGALLGGLGLLAEGMSGSTVCSLGFNAFSPDGDPAILSAGHCTNDGARKTVYLTDPAQDPAADPSFTGNPNYNPEFGGYYKAGQIGTFGFSQFGGTGNTTNTGTRENPTNIGTDVAVIEDIDSQQWAQLPAVTDWSNPADPASSRLVVTGVSEPVLNEPICKSGRTTGWTCSTISEIGLFFVDSSSGVRVIQGYGAEGLDSEGGDSGGAHVSGRSSLGPNIFGTRAIGITSAGADAAKGTKERTYGASIGPMLAAAGSYTLQVFVPAPVLTAPLDGQAVAAGETIRGTSQPGTDLVVTFDGEQHPVELDSEGNWSFDAPADSGVLEFMVQAFRGFSASAHQRYTLLIDEPVQEHEPAQDQEPVQDQEPEDAPADPALSPGRNADGVDLSGGNAAGELPADGPESDSGPVPDSAPAPAPATLTADGQISRLPETGMSALLPLTAAASVLLLGGAAAIVFGRRRPIRA